jgi:peptidase E
MAGTKPLPIHLMAGGPGSLKKAADPTLVRIIESTGVKNPAIAYIGAASGDNRRFFGFISEYLKKAGAGEILLAPLSGRPDIKKARAIIGSADLIFVSGGDVEAGMDVLDKTGISAFLRAMHAAGRRIMGVSAGSIMLARQWVRWRVPDDDGSAEAFPCLGLAPVLCDTHGEEDAWEELHALINLLPDGEKGYGLRTGATISVDWKGNIKLVAGTVDVFTKKRGKIRHTVL